MRTNIFVCMVATALAGPLAAQYYDDPGLGQRPVAAHPQDYKPLGVRAGGFMLHPGVQIGAEYTDNVFFSNQDQESDTVIHVRPYITAQSTWNKHSLDLTAAADIARYADFSDRDYEDYFFGASGRVDVRTRSSFSYALDYMDLHEDLNNRSSEQGVEPTRMSITAGTLGYEHSFNRLSLKGAYSRRALDYDDVLAGDGDIIDNQDRDRDEDSLMLRAGYQFQTDKQAFLGWTGYQVDYDQPLDRSGYARSGDGYSIDGGIAFTITGKLKGDVFATYHDRQYDDPDLPEISGWGGGAGLQWAPTSLTRVYGRIDTSVEETTNANSSGYLRTLYSLRVDHELRRFLQLTGFLSYSDNDFELIDATLEGTRENDRILRAGLGLNWFINRWMYLNTSYDYEKLDSDVPNDGYDVNRVWLLLGLEY